MSVPTEVAKVETLRATVDAPGVVTPDPEADQMVFAPEVTRVVEMPRAEGDTVQAGDELVRFDIGGLDQQVASRESDVQMAQSRFDAAQASFKRMSDLGDRGIVARRDVEQASDAVSAAQSALTDANQQLAIAKRAADQNVVRARFAGVVVKRYHNEGDLVNGTTADPVIRVIDPARLQVKMEVPVQEAAQIALKQSATIASSVGNEAGHVVARSLPVDARTATADVRIGFDTPTSLAVDTPVQVEVLIDTRQDVVTVPSSAVRRDDSGASFVAIAGNDGRAHRHTVQVGLTAGDRIEISAGLAPGERVILEPDDVAEGVPVIVQ